MSIPLSPKLIYPPTHREPRKKREPTTQDLLDRLALLEQHMATLQRDLATVRMDIEKTSPLTTVQKSALCIGINYKGTSQALQGCINDAHRIASLLSSSYHYQNITLLTDDTPVKPTRANILSAIKTLITDKSTIKTLTFSGHGSNVFDRTNDEKDRRDETWVAIDKQNIVDDELFAILSLLPSDKTLYIVSDSCHSGTVFDLPYTLSSDGKTMIQQNHNTLASKKIYMISGCMDSQFSYDALIDTSYVGAMSWSLLSSLALKRVYSPYELVSKMQTLLSTQKFNQNPQWSSSSSSATGTQEIEFFN